MPTTFATTTFTVLVTINSYGALSPVDKSVLPPGQSGPIMWNVDQCNVTRGKMEHPEKFTCQVFTSAKSTAWTYSPSEGATGASPPQENSVQPDTSPERRSEAASPFNDVRVGRSRLAEKDSPYIEPLVEPAKDPTLPTKRVVRRQTQRHQQPQFDPIGMVAALFTPRDW